MSRQARYLGDALRREGARIIEVDTVGGLSVYNRFTRLIRMTTCLPRIHAADIVLIFAGSYLSFFAFSAWPLLAAKVMGKPTVLLYKGGQAADFLDKSGVLCKPFLKLADAVAIPGPLLAGVFARYGIKTSMAPDLLDTSFIKPNDPPSGRPIVAVVRRHHPVYGIDIAIKVAAKVAERVPEILFEIANEGEDYERLKATAERLAPNNVRFTGQLGRGDMAELMRRATLLLNTSRYDNHPNSLVEAAIAGLPIVTTDAGGIPYMFAAERECLMAPVDDVDALAEAVVRVILDPGLRAALAENARKRSGALFRNVSEPGILAEYLGLIPDKSKTGDG